ncbi:MAG TPA: hypothetical protein DCE23_05730, partial [Firmicutes bacterium]|nr:hypothetical protein [Bacillota bacterium]
MIFDATKYSNIVKLPQSLKVEELSTKEEDNKYILNYGIPATESIPEQPLYEITYNINYYEYITDKYILNSPNTTIY